MAKQEGEVERAVIQSTCLVETRSDLANKPVELDTEYLENTEVRAINVSIEKIENSGGLAFNATLLGNETNTIVLTSETQLHFTGGTTTDGGGIRWFEVNKTGVREKLYVIPEYAIMPGTWEAEKIKLQDLDGRVAADPKEHPIIFDEEGRLQIPASIKTESDSFLRDLLIGLETCKYYQVSTLKHAQELLSQIQLIADRLDHNIKLKIKQLGETFIVDNDDSSVAIDYKVGDMRNALNYYNFSLIYGGNEEVYDDIAKGGGAVELNTIIDLFISEQVEASHVITKICDIKDASTASKVLSRLKEEIKNRGLNIWLRLRKVVGQNRYIIDRVRTEKPKVEKINGQEQLGAETDKPEVSLLKDMRKIETVIEEVESKEPSNVEFDLESLLQQLKPVLLLDLRGKPTSRINEKKKAGPTKPLTPKQMAILKEAGWGPALASAEKLDQQPESEATQAAQEETIEAVVKAAEAGGKRKLTQSEKLFLRNLSLFLLLGLLAVLAGLIPRQETKAVNSSTATEQTTNTTPTTPFGPPPAPTQIASPQSTKTSGNQGGGQTPEGNGEIVDTEAKQHPLVSQRVQFGSLVSGGNIAGRLGTPEKLQALQAGNSLPNARENRAIQEGDILIFTNEKSVIDQNGTTWYEVTDANGPFWIPEYLLSPEQTDQLKAR